MEELTRKIKALLYLNSKNREEKPINLFSESEIKYLKNVFFTEYGKILFERGVNNPIFGEKEDKISINLFNWCICSHDFIGDVKKGIWLASEQGFGKDVFLKTIVNFFGRFEKYFTEYSFAEFNKDWFDHSAYYFNRPIKINDINEYGYVKRERLSIPFLEFMDHREQTNNRRGIIVSSNYTPASIQDKLEANSENPRIEERAKECFNLIIIEDSKSKRIENRIKI